MTKCLRFSFMSVLMANAMLAVLPTSSVLASYPSAMDCNGRESFNWYCSEPKKPKMPPLPEKKQEPLPEPEPELTYEEQKLKEFKELQQRLEDLKHIAIIDPTKENVAKYIEEQLRVQKMAAVFADTWKRVQWADPALDYSVTHPVNNAAKKVSLENRRVAIEHTLSELSENGWGLWFFYSSTCSYCTMMAPILNMIQEEGMQVLGISLDGQQLPGLNAPFVLNNGQAEELQVSMTPTVFLANKFTRDVAPISYGATSYNELTQRIYVITQTEPGENY